MKHLLYNFVNIASYCHTGMELISKGGMCELGSQNIPIK